MSLREILFSLRGLITRGVVTRSDDDGETQVVDVTARHGAKLTKVEVAQPFGFASNAPTGGLTILLAVGGDQSDLVALPISDPSGRLGKLAAGEAAIYGADGSRVHIKNDGSIDVVSSTKVTARVPGIGSLEIAETYVRGALETGEKVAVTTGVAKLVAAGHFIAATAAGPRVSAMPVVSAEPAPEV